MRLVFWQNCLSPHQLPYIVKLLDDNRVDSVVVATDEAVNQDRKDMGWTLANYPGLDKCDVHINPQGEVVEMLLGERIEDSVHLFSGIRSFAFVHNVFVRSLKYEGIHRALITERPYTFAFGRANGKPLWLHWLRWKLQDAKNMKYVDDVFAMGRTAAKFYRSVNGKWNVYPFGYCTQSLFCADGSAMTGSPRISFVGSLSKRKAVETLLISTMLMQKKSEVLNIEIIGNGTERKKLEDYCNAHGLENVSFLGTQKQTDVPHLLVNRDILVLPSIYDGWGAVVNEALQLGLYVICSDKCGAKDLLSDSRNGAVFKGGNSKDLASKLEYVCQNIEVIRANRQWRKDWAVRCISGKAMAKYMVNCLSGINCKEPWV